jgi:hypothetical protein
MHTMSRSTSYLRVVVRRVAMLLFIIVGSSSLLGAPVPHNETHGHVRAVMALQKALTDDVLQWPDILGTAVGINDGGDPDLVVYVDSKGSTPGTLVEAVLLQYLYIPARAELTDKFVAYKNNPEAGRGQAAGHTARQASPIQLGTSGGWRFDLANGYCCGGTLGSLIQVNGVQYIMSNYHVFESDIVLGGNSLVASTGSPVTQPGLIDVGCNANNAQNVGTLVKLGSLPGSNVDVSVAMAASGAVRTDGAILEIGTLSSQTVAPFLNQGVKKSGRTTGLTRSQINGLNATISVQYENECAGSSAFVKVFTGQIVIANRRNGFLNSGDSGSLMVEDVAVRPRAVGLLFAGSNTSAIANPIGQVLQFVGAQLGGAATMVGN